MLTVRAASLHSGEGGQMIASSCITNKPHFHSGAACASLACGLFTAWLAASARLAVPSSIVPTIKLQLQVRQLLQEPFVS